jgi:ribonuclease T1
VSFFARPPRWQALRKTGQVVSVVARVGAIAFAVASSSIAARETGTGSVPSTQATVSVSALPAEARVTDARIRAGGPFRSDRDGALFANRERNLPPRARGYYREYTVPTPGARNRGARRIVCGGTPPVQPEVCYYTGDHYATFRRIVP